MKSGFNNALRLRRKKPNHDLGAARRPPLGEREKMLGDRLHHALVLDLVAVAIVDVGDPALDVILNPVHRVAAEPQLGDRRAVRSPEIVRRHLLPDAEPPAYLAHLRVQLGAARKYISALAVADDLLCGARNPHAVIPPVLDAGPPRLRVQRAGKG